MLGTFSSLIVLVQHISTILQAPNIAAAAGPELREVVRAEIPKSILRLEIKQFRGKLGHPPTNCESPKDIKT
jgi:hypothetical protein